jgi:nucleotide-binding universal stress UspA family protein
MSGPVVVGIDDLEHSKHALEVAAHEARIRGVPLWLVHAYQWLPTVAFGVSAGIGAEEALRRAAAELLDEAVALIRAEHPGLSMETVPVGGAAATVLNEACADAGLLVVGGRGRGGFAGQLLGSVALRVLNHAHVPVMVVRGPARVRTGRVVVGVDLDAPATGPAVLEFAVAEAELREADVTALNVWEDPTYLYHQAAAPFAPDVVGTVRTVLRKELDGELGPAADRHPSVAVSPQIFLGSPARVLVDSSPLADVLVLGGRTRHEGHEGMRIGAVAHAVLHHATCPVVIVPDERR